MASIEGNAVIDGVSRPGVRAHLYPLDDAGNRGSRISTDVTPSKAGREVQRIDAPGRFYFGNVSPGTYIVYLQGRGFNGEVEPAHRQQFVIVDDNPVPDDTLMLSGGTLVRYNAGGLPAVALPYDQLSDSPTGLSEINAGEGTKLSGIETGAQVASSRILWQARSLTGSTGFTQYTTTSTTWVGFGESPTFQFIKGRGSTVSVTFSLPVRVEDALISDTGEVRIELYGVFNTGATLYAATSPVFSNSTFAVQTVVISGIVDAEDTQFTARLLFRRIDNGGTGVVYGYGGAVYEKRSA